MLTIQANAQQKNIKTYILINGKSIGRKYDGIGSITQGGSTRLLIDYPEPERSQILDYLFKPGYGASLQVLKVGIGGDSNATDGAEPTHMRGPHSINCNRGWEWWIMEQAKKRNPNIKFVAQQWSGPGWLGQKWSKADVNYQLAWLRCAEKHDLHVDYIGGWNEKNPDLEGFKDLHNALKKEFPDVKVPAADVYNWNIADSMAADPELKNAVDVVAVHSPCKWRTHYRKCFSTETAQNLGKPLWLAANSVLGWDQGAGANARAINRMYIDGKMVSYLTWNLTESRYSNLSLGNTGIMGANWPWSGYYQLGKNIWAYAHTTQFTEPGWHYLNTGSKRLDDKATIVSLADSTGRDYSMIIEAMDMTRADTISLQLQNLPPKVLHLWTTNIASDDTSDYFQHKGTIVPNDGRFTLIIKPNHLYSMTTTTGQGKGHARPDASIHDRMEMPYHEDFEKVQKGKMAPLYTSLNGAFEAQPCQAGRSGTCYEQVVSQQPIIWNNTGKMPPTAMFGDPRWWGDYMVSADVLLKEEGYIEIIGRVTGQLGWTPYLGGYHFHIGTDGWKLYSENSPGKSKTIITSGSESIEPGKWHNVALKMQADHIDLMLDGERIQRIRDSRQLSGNVALRASMWQNAQFDNVTVAVTGGKPKFIPYDDISVAEVSSEQDVWGGWNFEAGNVIDDRLGTQWQSKKKPKPHSLTLDLGKARSVQALWLRPRRPYFDKNNTKNITQYRIEVSRDGRTFHTAAEGSWADTGSAKLATFNKKYNARFVRLIALDGTTQAASASEIRLIKQLPAGWKN